MLSFLTSCFSPSNNRYVSLSSYKKEDNFGANVVEEWIKNDPVNPHLYELTDKKVREYVRNMIKTLPASQLTHENIDIAKEHLQKVAHTSQRAKRWLLEELEHLKASAIEQGFKETLNGAIWKAQPIFTLKRLSASKGFF